jgi:hypothetical protein
MSDNRKDNLVVKHIANQALGRAQCAATLVGDHERDVKQRADKAEECDKDYRVLTSLGSTRLSPTATPHTHNHPTDGPLPGGLRCMGGLSS